MRLALILFLLSGATCVAAQSVGSPAPNKVFLNSWNTPAGYNQLDDYFVPPGHVVLLDWWGVT